MVAAAGTPGLWRRCSAIWLSGGAAHLGDGIYITALPLVAAGLTRNPTEFAVISAAAWLPWLVLSLPAGVLADRWSRRRLVQVTAYARVLVLAALAVALHAGMITLWGLCAVAVVLGVAEVGFDTALRASLPSVTGEDELEKANNVLFGVETVALRLCGPAIAGWAVATASPLPFLIDAGLFLVAGLLAARLPRHAGTSAVTGGVRELLRWLRRNPAACSLVYLGLIVNGFGGAVMGVLPLFALHELHLGPGGYGILISAAGVGTLVGTQLVNILLRLGRARVVLFSLVLFALVTGVQGAISDGFVMSALIAVFAAISLVWNVVVISALQNSAPPEYVGRVTSLVHLAAWGAMPVGALLGGALATPFGLRAPFFVAASVWAVTAFVSYLRVDRAFLDGVR